jgi:cytochrome oxidase Cu insertion factor (SCO1/SenC/PrrC family)
MAKHNSFEENVMTDRRHILRIIPAAALGLASFGLQAAAQDSNPAEGLNSGPGKTFDPKKQRQIPDPRGITHTGKTVNFYQDLILDKVVLINFFSIAGEDVYPVTARLAEVAKLLGNKLGQDIQMISVTRDPANDTPERLAAFASRFGNPKGWTFVNLATQGTAAMTGRVYHTGGKHPAPTALKNPAADVVFYGNGAVGLWSTFPVDIQAEDAARRALSVMSVAAVDTTLRRAGPRRPAQPGLTSDNRIA